MKTIETSGATLVGEGGSEGEEVEEDMKEEEAKGREFGEVEVAGEKEEERRPQK